MIKGSNYQVDIIIINICALNIRTPKYIKQLLTKLKREIDSNKMIGDFNTLLSIMARNPNRRSKRTLENILSEKKPHNIPKLMGCSKSSTKREFYSNKYIAKVERSQINNLNLHLKELEKEEPNKCKVSRRKEII